MAQTTSRRGSAKTRQRTRNNAGSRSTGRSRNSRSQNSSRGNLSVYRSQEKKPTIWQRLSGSTREVRDYYDYNLLAVVILLTCFGLVMLYSTSAYEAELQYGSDTFFFGKQALISIAAVVAMIIGSQIDYHNYVKWASFLYYLSLFLLIITKFIGREVNGARRWIYIGPLSFQPAELAKLAVILYLPYLIIQMSQKRMETTRAAVTVFGFASLSAFLTYEFTDNLSSGVIIFGIGVILIFVINKNTRAFAYLAAAGGAVLLIARFYIFPLIPEDTESFRLRRILVWLDPTKYADEGGYQVTQARYAIGSGGFFGKGLGKSTQKLGAIPEAQNDMIFSIICEELGVFGAAIVIGLFVFLLYRLFFIARNAPDLLGSLIATGIFSHISLQVVLNIAVVTGILPTTGITLPFVSYGGTSIVFLMAEMMLALSISNQITFR